MNTFLLEIVTPERIVFSEQVESLSVRGEEGELGILAGHVPLVTPLKVAPISVKSGNTRATLAVHGGFLEVQKDKVILLAEGAERSTDIDVERAKAARERAERRLNSQGNRDLVDHRRAELALQRAVTRINVSSHSKE
ncbi:F-type H+-transporting ATPase subunit epsilon [Paenibacillus shirakamiensis]|uniref:ATP synthase epsilon chain n=1 Tax=Paenibacillus shirakamiensis TaxID=1265935 RepID=A0ABS4JJD3_9BACL|nr:F0F1 ATP synthase subunit epsilon [Paenibacillus shirakamiensis]MBP2001814.1 F-type H+-transporting ATPase subunit epsilon [Paenibacillus shirakamiensis]